MQQNNMVYSTNDSLLTMNAGGSVTQHGPYELTDYATTYPRMLDTSYLGGEESWDTQAATLENMPTTTATHLMMMEATGQHQQQPQHQNNTALNKIDTSSASMINNTQEIYWSSSPPTNGHPSPIPNDFPPSNGSMATTGQDQAQYPEWYQVSASTTPSTTYSSSCSPPSYQELMSLDICPISPPYSSSNLPYSFSMPGSQDSGTRKYHPSGARSARRHTVSTSNNNNNARMIGMLDMNHHQQMKMRKVMKPKAKQQRPRSLSQNEQPIYYPQQLDTSYPLLGPWSTPPSSSCDASCCGSPISAEYLLNEQRLDWMMDPVYSKTPSPSLMNGQQDAMYQVSPSSSTAPYFSPPLPLSACSSSSFSPAVPCANYVPSNVMIGAPPLAYNGVMDDEDRNTMHLQGNEDNDDEDDGAPFICQWADCAMEFEKQPHLIAHVKTLHIGTGKSFYQCRWNDCQRGEKPFTKRHKMHNHLRTHTKERPYICMEEGCGKRFARPDSLATHGKIHTNIRPYECQHDGCQKAYYHLRSLRKHEKSHKL